MYYYYDILLNFAESDNELYEFYEWEEHDNIEFIKKIPLFKVSTSNLKILLKYQVKFAEEILEQIKNKTILKNFNSTLPYCLLVCDTKNSLALELNEQGEVISRSHLLLCDEINLNEIMYTMKEQKLKFEKLNKYPHNADIRQIAEIKKIIACEIKTLYEQQNISKLKYLYFEWFDKTSDDLQNIYKEMCFDLQQKFSPKHQNIYEIIKLSYDKVK